MGQEINQSNTKKEILEAYNQLKQKIVTEKEGIPSENQQAKKQEDLLTKASSCAPGDLMKSIADLKITITRSLDQVEEKLINEYKKLSNIQEAIKIEEENLHDTYQIKSEADSLAALIQAQKEKKESFEKEMHELQEKWEKEKAQMQQSLKEEKERKEKERKREEEEYNYNVALKRKKEEDAYKEKVAKQEKDIQEKQIAFEKQIQEREANIKDSEQELAGLRAKAEKFPEELEEAVKQKELQVSSALNEQHKFEKEMMKKDYEGELKLKDQTIQTHLSKINDQETLIKQLYEKAEHADQNVKDIVLKAIERSGAVNNMYEKHTKHQETNE